MTVVMKMVYERVKAKWQRKLKEECIHPWAQDAAQRIRTAISDYRTAKSRKPLPAWLKRTGQIGPDGKTVVLNDICEEIDDENAECGEEGGESEERVTDSEMSDDSEDLKLLDLAQTQPQDAQPLSLSSSCAIELQETLADQPTGTVERDEERWLYTYEDEKKIAWM